MDRYLSCGDSGMTRKKRCPESSSPQEGYFDNKEGEPRDEANPLKAMKDDIHLIHQMMDDFNHQVLRLLESGKAQFPGAATAFEEGILQLHRQILESWEMEIEELRNVQVANEETWHHLREARLVLEKLQVSAAAVLRLRNA